MLQILTTNKNIRVAYETDFGHIPIERDQFVARLKNEFYYGEFNFGIRYSGKVMYISDFYGKS